MINESKEKTKTKKTQTNKKISKTFNDYNKTGIDIRMMNIFFFYRVCVCVYLCFCTYMNVERKKKL